MRMLRRRVRFSNDTRLYMEMQLLKEQPPWRKKQEKVQEKVPRKGAGGIIY